MENSQLIGLTRQMALRRKMDVIANNLANINTSGYKSDNLLFKEFIMPVAKMNDFRYSDRKLSYVQDDIIAKEFKPGGIIETGNPVNAAINDTSSFFVIDSPNGERYTRNGQFEINSQGQLVTTEGYAVQGMDGPLNFTLEDTGIHISRDGLITSDRGEIGRLKVVTFDNLGALKKEGNSLFIGDNPIPVDDADILGGRIEQSNVSGVVEISRMIEVSRAYESLANALKATNDLRTNAIDTLGKLQA
ncbi:flagellar hook-basal body complex protein [uncultured Cohaesibacter sp.]|uniref:flagellar hook-basal body complex protein n=1 Tax=uncultured Cohaesibacter sp. TaxID=1002546 RepID=UPI0029319F53|nr:flagellar hook-basal body complex protein [uncultured Cohaesibacter sp.]